MITVAFADDTYSMTFEYTNYRGETAVRNARPVKMYFGVTQYHKDAQWLMDMIDLDRMQQRTFAMRNMREVPAS